MQPNNIDITRIANVGLVSAATVKRVFGGRGNAYSRARVAEACARLGLPLPTSERAVIAPTRAGAVGA